MVEFAGGAAKRVSDKWIALQIVNEPWLVFGRHREKHGCHPRIKLQGCWPQRLRHRRPKPGFVAGVHLLDLGIVQSVDLIGGKCFPTDHQSELAGLASRRDRGEPFTVFLHPFFPWPSGTSGVAARPPAGAAAGGAPSASPAPAPCRCSASDISSSISSSQSISPITSRRRRLI